ncbi:hypothetical protein D3C84_1096580 [compost metagenome]
MNSVGRRNSGASSCSTATPGSRRTWACGNASSGARPRRRASALTRARALAGRRASRKSSDSGRPTSTSGMAAREINPPAMNTERQPQWPISHTASRPPKVAPRA